MKIKIPKTSTMVAVGAVALGLATAGIGVTYAATGSNALNNPMNGLVNAIAQKFNLNTSDVQQVFDQQRLQMQAQHEQAYKDRLAQAVKDGKLTQDQADKITAKMTELKTQRESEQSSFNSLSPQERKTKIDAQISDLKKWEADNNIPVGYLPFGGGHMGMGRGGMMGQSGQMMGQKGQYKISGVDDGDSDGPQDAN